LQIELVEKLRSDMHFASENELVDQMHVDIEHARKSLKLNNIK